MKKEYRGFILETTKLQNKEFSCLVVRESDGWVLEDDMKLGLSAEECMEDLKICVDDYCKHPEHYD